MAPALDVTGPAVMTFCSCGIRRMGWKS